MRTYILAFAAVASLFAMPPAAWASPPSKPAVPAEVSTAALRFGRSVGSPTEGHLIGGSHLDDMGPLRICPVYADNDVRWGLKPLVQLLERGARAVRKQFPDAVMTVGHLSRKGGGEVSRHHSHETGRDADVGFYLRTQSNKPLLTDRFVAFRGDGTTSGLSGAVFDDARNWALVSSFVSDPDAHVSYIFVSTPLRARLLAYADKIGAPKALRNRAAQLMTQPRGSLPHDDHFHVRIACPAGMTGCIEYPTMTKLRLARAGRSTTRVRSKTGGPLPPLPQASTTSNTTPSTPKIVSSKLPSGVYVTEHSSNPLGTAAQAPGTPPLSSPWGPFETPAASIAAPLTLPTEPPGPPPAEPLEEEELD